MKQVALLPTHGDPFMLKHFMVNYDRVWRGEVDELHVLVSSCPDPEIAAYCKAIVEQHGGKFIGAIGPTMDHGLAMRQLAEHAVVPHHGVNADVIAFFEGDSRVRFGNEVRGRVEAIASHEATVIGSPRISMDGRLDTACREKWGPKSETTRDGCEGYGLWPCFLFVDAKVLVYETDRNYGARGWLAGETIEGLGIACPEDGWCADTFGSAALQLRGRHSITADVQYKGPWQWDEWLDAGHDMPWFHTGSLSSWGGSGGLVVDGDSELMDGRRLTDPHERLEWGHRLAWWERFLETSDGLLPRAEANYRRNIQRLQEIMGIPRECVDHWARVVERLITWEER